MNSPTTRRTFLRRTTLGGAGLLILRNSRSAWSYEANEKLDIALVGVDGRGKWFVNTIPKLGENVVALCDVDEKRALEAFGKIPQAKQYRDFRRMLEEMDKQIDAVIVATPDHTHAVISLTAMKLGKHVYCEKPLTRTVYESRIMRETARAKRVASQMGNQGTASGQFRRAVELIRAGTLGEIKEVHIWNSGGGPGRKQPPAGAQLIPEHFKWDLWLGPAPDRSYHPDWVKWHAWRDFGTGQLGNWASHSANLAFMALKVDSLWHAKPSAERKLLLRIEAKVSQINRISFPRWEIIRFKIPPRGQLPPITFNWYNGSRAPGARDLIEELMGRRLDWGDAGERKWRDHAGGLIVGTKGKLHATGHNATFSLIPEDRSKNLEDLSLTMPRSPGHEREWLEACKEGPAAMSNFDYAGPLAELLLLGNVATQFEHEITYDPLTSRITNSERANEALHREYRQGWLL